MAGSQAADAYAAFEAALTQLLDAIRTESEPEDAWTVVDQLQEQIEGPVRSDVKLLRAQVAHRIWEERKLSLAGLGRALGGKSRARAEQLLRIADGKERQQ
jgi:hypothetical protein